MKTFAHATYSAVQSIAKKAEQSRQIAEDSAGIPVTVVPFGKTGIPLHEPGAKKYSEWSFGRGMNASKAAATRGGKC